MSLGLERPASGRLQAVALLLLVIFVGTLATIVSSTRGPFFDEMWTMWMAAPELSIRQAAHLRWFQDVHPPLYYFLNRLAWPLLAEDIFWHRLTNLVPVALLGALALHLARSQGFMRGVLAVTLVLVFSNSDIEYLIEYRSYTLVLCASTAMTLVLYRLTWLDRDLDPAGDRGLMVLIAGILLLALNIHYFASLICGVAVGVVTLDQLRLRHIRWAIFLVVCVALSSIPLLATLAAERAYMAVAVPEFWIDTSPIRTLALLAQVGLEGLGYNLVLVCGLFWVIKSRVEGRQEPEHPLAVQWRFALLMAMAAAIASSMILAASLVRPMVVARYLVALTPIYAIGFAVLAERFLLSRRWLYLLFVVNGAGAAIIPLAQQFNRPLWNESASVIARGVRACPAARVYAMERHDLPLKVDTPALPNGREFMHWALPRLGRHFGFAVEAIEPGQGLHPRSPGNCQTYVWSEHVKRNAPDTVGTIRAAGLNVAPSELPHVRRFDSRSGFVLMVPPLRR